MGVTSAAAHWWEEWQLRVLVLSSFLVQVLLFFLSCLRRRYIPGWFRSMIALAFIAGNTVAISALATLFDRHKGQGHGGRSSILEVVWAPVLLMHLGGQDGISACSIEDNERWIGHLFTAAYQVALVTYVFYKSWSWAAGDEKLLQAAELMFVLGILKCFDRPWALKRASFTSLIGSHSAEMRRPNGGEDDEVNVLENYVTTFRRTFVKKQNHEDEDEDEDEGEGEDEDEGEAQGARSSPSPPSQPQGGSSEINHQPQGRRRRRHSRDQAAETLLHGEAYKLMLDRPSPYGRRLRTLEYFFVLSDAEAYGLVRQVLASAFLRLYTRLKLMTVGGVGWEHEEGLSSQLLGKLTRVVLPLAAIGLFHQSHREAYNHTDVKVTYALFYCTAVLEAYYAFGFPLILAKGDDRVDHMTRQLWPETVAQYSLVGYLSRNKKHRYWMLILSVLGCKGVLDQHWSMSSCFSAGKITGLVLGYLKAGWKDKIHDAASYRRFNDSRGHWALQGNENLCWSIERQFDESVLLWHIATDFCFFSRPVSENIIQTTSERVQVQESTKLCRQMSNYMVHLLFCNPEMLSPGTNRGHFINAYDELQVILSKNNPLSWSHWKEEMLMKRVISTMSARSNDVTAAASDMPNGASVYRREDGRNGNFIEDAWDLAQGLMKLRDEFGDDKMWEVIQGVWVEMLCFSASRCRGYLHAKALGSGGEFLSYVWLLLFYMGMETFTERLQREELPSPVASTSDADDGRTSSTSGTRNRTTTSTSEVHTSVSSPSSSGNHIVGEELV